MLCSKSPEPLGVFFHVVQVGSHDEVFGVEEAVLVWVLLPARVVALVGDVAFASPRLKTPWGPATSDSPEETRQGLLNEVNMLVVSGVVLLI